MRTNIENMETIKSYMQKKGKDIGETAENLQSDVKSAHSLHDDIYKARNDLNNAIKEYCDARKGQLESIKSIKSTKTASEIAKFNDKYKEIQEVAHPVNWDTTATAIKELYANSGLLMDHSTVLEEGGQKLGDVCKRIDKNIKVMQDALINNDDLREEALMYGFIGDGKSVARTESDLLNEKFVHVHDFKLGSYWDGKPEFLFEDGAMMILIDGVGMGFTNCGAIAKIAEKISDSEASDGKIVDSDKADEEWEKENADKKEALGMKDSGKGSGTDGTEETKTEETKTEETKTEETKTEETKTEETDDQADGNGGTGAQPDKNDEADPNNKEIVNATTYMAQDEETGNYAYKMNYNADGKQEVVNFDKNTFENKLNKSVKDYLENTDIALYEMKYYGSSPIKETKIEKLGYDNVQKIELKEHYIVLHTNVENSAGKNISYKINVNYADEDLPLSKYAGGLKPQGTDD